MTSAVTPAAEADAPEMGEYPASAYAVEAGRLDAGLVAAIEDDLGVSAAEYLATADAAVDAADVLDHLEQQNVDTTDAVLDGTTLTVLVDSADAADDVAALGATPVFEPTAEMLADYSDVRFEAAADLLGGTGWAIPAADGNGDGVSNDGYVLCSVGFNGRLKSDGAPQLATAGHCLDGTAFPGSSARAVVQSKPADPASALGVALGSPVGVPRNSAAVSTPPVSRSIPRGRRGPPSPSGAGASARPRPARRSRSAARRRRSSARSSASRGARPGGPAAPCSK